MDFTNKTAEEDNVVIKKNIEMSFIVISGIFAVLQMSMTIFFLFKTKRIREVGRLTKLMTLLPNVSSIPPIV